MRRNDLFLYGAIAICYLLVTLLWQTAHADIRPDQDPDHFSHVVLSFGPTLNGNTNPKMAGIGYEHVWHEASLLAECRGIFSAEINGACAVVLSARVETLSGLFIRVGVGPAWYFRIDDRVSSHLNANLQGVVGLTSNGWAVGAGYWHYSNAGLVPPNLGRDYIGPVVEIGL